MKLILWVFTIFVAVGSLYGSMHMDYPYPFFIVAGIVLLVYWLSSKSSNGKWHKDKAERDFQRMLYLHKNRPNR